MKKIFLAVAVLLSASTGFAQSKLNFTATLANTTGRTITKESIMIEPKVQSSPTPSAVSSFKVSFLPTGKDVIGPFEVKGNRLEAKHLDIIKGLKKGDKISIENIQVSSGKEFTAQNVVYVIEK